ncbi:hypothetical protein DM02DRAFT_609190 [Periconia macrospinosa]|uniref:tRNA-splicing endonuclease subunit Sen54 N-terminal domain-containing protein n=1 Tax=Periconia macrospinosa TaxID=97972 RepID=A0A2V1EA33_9PLEO|nr:hypothetical protein DM02DRAFT_609190 [Periconia macrospinosa]
MADEDEDAPNLQAQDAEEIEDEEGGQEYLRALNKLAGTPQNISSLSLPKRGEKDFESHSTQLQVSTLETSRAAMHSVLSWQRTHTVKNHVIAMYHEASNMVFVEKVKTSMFNTMGRSKEGKEWLLPEEALFMIERGSLDCRWPVNTDEHDGEKENDEKKIDMRLGAPMSLQGAYAAFLGFEGGVGGKLTLEMYIVYAGLKRAGYVVFRHGNWDDDRGELEHLAPTASEKDAGSGIVSRFFAQLWRRITHPTHTIPAANLAFGPLIKPGLYRSHAEIYRLLHLIPAPAKFTPPHFILPPDPSNPYRIHFNVWKTSCSQKFRKTNRPPPDFRICVVNARETSMPTAAQLNDLLATVPDDPPPSTSTNIFQKLKHGRRNVILAIVDNGIPSYLTLTDASFSEEKVYDRGVKGGRGKGGGRGRGGARGRGRGRGRGK